MISEDIFFKFDNRGKRKQNHQRSRKWLSMGKHYYLTIRIRARDFYLFAIEIESEYYNCFRRNLWRSNKRNNWTILFFINNYWIYSNYQCWWYTSATIRRVKLSSWYFKFNFSLPLKYFLAILVFSGIISWIRAFNSSFKTSEKREKDTILHFLFTSHRHYLSPDW